MPHRDWKFRIQDILDAVRAVREYTQRMDFKSFVEDRKTVDAVAGLSQEDANICHRLSIMKTATTKQLLSELPLSKATINRRLGKLAKEGWVKIHGSGRGVFYSLEYGPGIIEPK